MRFVLRRMGHRRRALVRSVFHPLRRWHVGPTLLFNFGSSRLPRSLRSTRSTPVHFASSPFLSLLLGDAEGDGDDDGVGLLGLLPRFLIRRVRRGGGQQVVRLPLPFILTHFGCDLVVWIWWFRFDGLMLGFGGVWIQRVHRTVGVD